MMVAAAAMFCATLGVARFMKRREHSSNTSPVAAHLATRTPWGNRFWTLAPACLAMSVGGTFRTSWGGPYLADVFGFDLWRAAMR